MYFFLKDVRAVGVREPLQAPQAQAEVSKLNPVSSAVCVREKLQASQAPTGVSKAIFFKYVSNVGTREQLCAPQ